jgi:ketosteroid isomerase-like protein
MRLGLVTLAVVAWGCCPRVAHAQDSSSPFEIAESYLDALYSFDFGTLRTLLAPDATFRDPTGDALAGTEISYHGRDAVLSQFEASASTLRNARFEMCGGFDSGEYVVLNLIYRFDVYGEAFGFSESWIPVAMPAVTILRIVDGRVQEHLDHADYDELVRQLEELAVDPSRTISVGCGGVSRASPSAKRSRPTAKPAGRATFRDGCASRVARPRTPRPWSCNEGAR